jgi:hypothetical protein
MCAWGMSHIIGKLLVMATTLLELTPIHLLVKEFIQGIVRFNTYVIDSVVQKVLVLLIEDTMAKILWLP